MELAETEEQCPGKMYDCILTAQKPSPIWDAAVIQVSLWTLAAERHPTS